MSTVAQVKVPDSGMANHSRRAVRCRAKGFRPSQEAIRTPTLDSTGERSSFVGLAILVGALFFFDNLFFATLAPLLPVYQHRFGLSKAQLGVLSGAFGAGVMLGAVVGGYVVTRRSAKRGVQLGLLLITIASTAFGFADSLLTLFAARICQGIGSGVAWTGGLAWLMAAAQRDKRGGAMGASLGAAVVGGLIGPVVGATAFHLGTEGTFSAVAALGVPLILWTTRLDEGAPDPFIASKSLRGALRDPLMQLSLWFVSLPAILLGALAVVAPVHLAAAGWSVTIIAAAWVTAGVIQAIGSPIIGRLSDRTGRLPPLHALLVLSALASLALIWADGRAHLLIAIVVCASVAYGSLWVPSMALLSDAAQTAGVGQARVLALQSVWAPGYIIGSAVLAGLLGSLAGDKMVLLSLALINIATLIWSRYTAKTLTQLQ